MSDSASENIKSAVSKLDSSMSKMVEQDPDNLMALYGTIRLQVENLEAKVNPFVDDQEEADDNHYFWSKINEAENYYDKNQPLEPHELRKYIRLRLDAIYEVLNQKGIYQIINDYDSDDLDVIRPRDIEEEEA